VYLLSVAGHQRSVVSLSLVLNMQPEAALAHEKLSFDLFFLPPVFLPEGSWQKE
jgi:hypothetical protein